MKRRSAPAPAPKKLAIRRDTVRQLVDLDLADVRGGETETTCVVQARVPFETETTCTK